MAITNLEASKLQRTTPGSSNMMMANRRTNSRTMDMSKTGMSNVDSMMPGMGNVTRKTTKQVTRNQRGR